MSNNDPIPESADGAPLFQMGQRVRHANSGRKGRVIAIIDDPSRLIDRYHYTVEWDTGEPEERETADIEEDLLEPL